MATGQRSPEVQIAKILEHGKSSSHHNWYRFFDLWLEAILLSLKPCTPQEWQEFISKNYLEKSEKAMTEAFVVLANHCRNDNRDCLGPLYELLAVNDKRYFGQFFTPWDVAVLMARLNFTLPEPDLYREEPYTIYDPCVGSGTLILAMVELVQIKDPIGFALGHYQFFGQDLDNTCASMASINLKLRGLNRPFVKFRDLDGLQQTLTLLLRAKLGAAQTEPAA